MRKKSPDGKMKEAVVDIEDFIPEWIDKQCERFAAEIEEIEALMKYLKDYKKEPEEFKRTPKLRVMPGTEEVSTSFGEAIQREEALKVALSKSQTNPVRCRCGDWTYGNNGTCGPNGCYNCPA